VDSIDLGELGFDGVVPETTGRPAYHPAVLLKLYIYGYLNRVQSSRRLEREAGRNVEVMWLIGRLVPDHKTIADFRKDNGRAIPRAEYTHTQIGKPPCNRKPGRNAKNFTSCELDHRYVRAFGR
jgi:transposase